MPFGLSDLVERAKGVALGAGRGAGFAKMLTAKDFMTDDAEAKAGKFNKIGEMVIPAQQQYEWGYGIAGQPENQGYIYMDLKDDQGTPVQVEGTIRLCVSDANEEMVRPIYTNRTEPLRGSQTDKTMKVPLPRTPPRLSEDDKMIIQIDPDVDQITQKVSKTNSTLNLPVTNYYVGALR